MPRLRSQGLEPITTSESKMEGDLDESFALNLLNALHDDQIVQKLVTIFTAANKQVTDKLEATQRTLANLEKQLGAKDELITSLRQDIGTLEARVEDLEQYSRRDAMRIYGIPEDTAGSTDDKVLSLCNDTLKMDPPLSRDEIAVSHRTGKPSNPQHNGDGATGGQPDDGAPAAQKPRPILVKLVSRRTKARIMAHRRALRDVPAVYFTDDLTRNRARVAYLARGLKRRQLIEDTWVYDSKVLVKDKYKRVHELKSATDIERFQ